MRIVRYLPLLTSFLLFRSAHCQVPPEGTDKIMQEARQVASVEKKNILVIFHASWCGWCHKMDSSINDQNCKSFFDKSYIIRHLVVDESADKKNTETPGAADLLHKYQGSDEGIPFWLVLDKDGNLLADSEMKGPGEKGVNVGCPAEEKEVEYFIGVLKKTSHMSGAEQEAVRKRFRQNEDRETSQ